MSAKKIFISYSRRDTEYVKSLVEALRKQGFEVWFDNNIRTGTDWDDTIESELQNADAIVLILSKTSVASENVKDEISYAMGLDKPLSPIKIEECDVPMRLARKQYVDFTSMGHEAGFERLVKDLKISLKEAETSIPKGTFKPPVVSPTNANAASPKKSNKITPYIIGGAVVLVLIILLVALSTPDDTTEDNQVDYTNNSPNTYDNGENDTQTTTKIEEEDWTNTYKKNNLETYLAYLYTYGKSAMYYKEAYAEIKSFLPDTASVWYGIKGGEMHFSKYLYYAGDQTTPPQIDEVITPKFKSELYHGKNYERHGIFVQPGERLMVRDVWVDVNNNIWVGVYY